MDPKTEDESSEAAWEVQTATSVGFPSISSVAPSQSEGPGSVALRPSSQSSGRTLEEESDSNGNNMDAGVEDLAKAKKKKKKKKKSPDAASRSGSAPINDDINDEKIRATEKEAPTRRTVPPPGSSLVKSKKADESKPKAVRANMPQNSVLSSAMKKEVEFSSKHPTRTPGISMVHDTKVHASMAAAKPGVQYLKGSDRLQLAPGHEPSSVDVEEASREDSQPGAEHVFPNGGIGDTGTSWRSEVRGTPETAQSGDVPKAHVVDEAQLVDDAEIQQLREQVEQVENAPVAEVVQPGDNEEERSMRFLGLVIGAALIVILAGAGIAIAVTSSKSSSSSPLKPSLQRIRKRGYVKCRGQALEQEQGSGMSLDLVSASLSWMPMRVTPKLTVTCTF